MHVGGLQLFRPPEGASALDVRDSFRAAVESGDVAPVFRKRARRTVASLGQWAWEPDREFDLDHHVRCDALPQPGRVRELLALCSRLHSSLLDRRRPLWEAHLIEGLDDGRFAVYVKVHHAVVDGTHALGLLARALSDDPGERAMPAPWALRLPLHEAGASVSARSSLSLEQLADWAGDALGIVPALTRTVRRALNEQSAALSLRAPRTVLNTPISGARRFAAQSWPLQRIRQVAQRAGVTVNDVVLAMCSGALRTHLDVRQALPREPLIAMVPVSLDSERGIVHDGDGGGNAVGLVMCNLGTDQADAVDRLETVHRSMTEGKQSLEGMTHLQILAMSALGISPLGIYPLLHLNGIARPPFNIVISNIPGPRTPLYWNGARLDGLYPLSIPLDGQALNITCTSYSDQLAFGLTGCRRTVPHMQRMLGYLDAELSALERLLG